MFVTDTTILSINALQFRKNLLEEVKRVIMTIDEKLRDEKLQYDINEAAADLSTLSSSTIDKGGYLTGGEVSSHNSIV